ncbi:MAG: DEAD/DEAH box helicase, partial [bacterium]
MTDKTLWRSGDWALTRTQGEAVRILEVLDLWGKSACLVWQPAAGTVATVPAAELIPVSAAKVPSQPAIVYAVAAAKIMDSLAQSDLFLAPLEGTVVPLPHQLYALARALAGQRVRYLLADEVGLGKTIEAGLIMRELKLRGLVHRTLVVAPKGLVLQWVQEMQNHFNESFQLVIPAEMGALSYLAEDGNFWRRIPQAVVPLDSVKPIQGRRGWTHDEVQRYNRERFEKLVTGGWDLVIVDEAHRLAGSSDTVARYRLGRALAEAAPYVLFLSATPHQGKSDAFHRLVNLLDDEAFPTVDAVERERVAPYVIRTEKRQAVNLDGQPLF